MAKASELSSTSPNPATENTNANEFVPIDANGRLYRRILPGWYFPGKTKKIPQKAFMPRPWESEEKPGDKDGISVDRVELTTMELASIMPHSGKKAHVCEFGVCDILRRGLTVVAKPIDGNPAHAVIPEMNSLDCRNIEKEKAILEHAIALRDCAVMVYEVRAPD